MQPLYLEIAVNVPQVSGVFHYHLSPDLLGIVRPGHLVEVPFGEQRVHGVVLREVEKPAVPETKPVLQLVDAEVVLTPQQLALAYYLAESTLAPLSVCAHLMLPAGLSQVVDSLYTLRDRGKEIYERGSIPNGQRDNAKMKDEVHLTPVQKRLLGLLHKRGHLRGRQIDQALSRVNWRGSARSLARRGLISIRSILPPPIVRAKSARTARLACSSEEAKAQLPNLGREGSEAFKRKQVMLRLLIEAAEPVLVQWVYAESGGTPADLRFLVDRGLVVIGESEVKRDPLEGMEFVATSPPSLTKDQAAVWKVIQEGLLRAEKGDKVLPFLLHGVTGSGKTEIYLHAVAHVIRSGKQAIVLVPEIALTPQTVRRFVSRFPGQVGLVHSGLSQGERYDTWRRARRGELGVVVGARSALFTPLPQLGLVVVDECHEETYYQSDPPPYYHAREAAVAYARLTGAVCLLGSATPDLVDQYQAEQKRLHYLQLPARILAHQEAIKYQVEKWGSSGGGMPRYRHLEGQADTTDLPPVNVVDMRQELKSGNRSIFSRALQNALSQVLDKGQQAILFLNRRGSATYVFCRECGRSLECPKCDIPLTFHADLPGREEKTESGLICHRCGYRRKMPTTCPDCGSTRIRQYGAGTEKVESEVLKLFPKARTIRWDFETTRTKGAHDIILNHFIAHRADVLVGTQMLAKGLDLPLVTLVGVVLADVGLNLPDFRAAERTFQVLTQVAGRAGRSPLGGQVILQTFQPDHYVIQAASHHDYTSFYQEELAYRRQLGYPPFARLVRLEYRHVRQAVAEKSARELADQIRSWISSEDRRATQIIGPAPCFFSRRSGLYRWQIVLRSPDPVSLLRGRSLGEWRVEVDPPSLL